ncbi:Cysteine-rich RLK (RECEPTOR-like protein kinase) 8 [Theobroma cacao]|uniref:Cysteine-rich RLK (RECEPTOR-like protein kinase) 8 n=1 Tax=Theobroma cacao TaxID=3641 RepID=A0A061EW82_THECC|nr:Cysteine-rich RLK (RECEPTOR-like protein kinase) 8 [Theobroma cacao]
MQCELQALEDNATWSILPLPSDSHAIGCKWVFKVAMNADDTVQRYKARLVAKSNEFLNGDLDEVVYMDLPEGYSIKGEYPLGSKMVYEYGMLGTKPVTTLIDYSHKLSKAVDGKEVLSLFMEKPKQEHMSAAYGPLKYLKLAPGQGIFMKADSYLSILAYSDSDWVGCGDTRKSVTGSTEAEYKSMAAVCYEIMWLKYLLSDLGIKRSAAVKLYCDNQSAFHICRNPVFHERTKHIDMDHHFIREEVLERLIEPVYISTGSLTADLLTKALQPTQYHRLLHKMNIHDIHAPP